MGIEVTISARPSWLLIPIERQFLVLFSRDRDIYEIDSTIDHFSEGEFNIEEVGIGDL